MKYEAEMDQFLDTIKWTEVDKPVDEAQLETAWGVLAGAGVPMTTLARYVWGDAFVYPLNREMAAWVNQRIPWQGYGKRKRGGDKKTWLEVPGKKWLGLLTSNPWLVQWLDPRTKVEFDVLFLAVMRSGNQSERFDEELSSKIGSGQQVWDWILEGVKRRVEQEQRDTWVAPDGSELTYDEQDRSVDESGAVIPMEQWLAGDLYKTLQGGLIQAGMENNQEGVKYLLEYPGWVALAPSAVARKIMVRHYSIDTEALEAFETSMEEHLVKQATEGRGISKYEQSELRENAPGVWERGSQRIRNWELRRSLARLLPPGKPEVVARL